MGDAVNPSVSLVSDIASRHNNSAVAAYLDGHVEVTKPSTYPRGILPSGSLLSLDTSTKGTWSGVYGSAGFAIDNSTTSYPSFATVTITGKSDNTWSASTTDVRALQTTNGGATRASTCWYTSSNMTFNIVSTGTHQLAMYCLDWDSQNRNQTIQVYDSTNTTVLSTQTITAFTGGKWLVWTITGTVNIKVTNNGACNCVVSGLFWD